MSTPTPRVLIADKLSPEAMDIFQRRGVEAVVRTGLSRDDLIAAIPDFDGIAVRSATKVTGPVIDAGKRLKIGRAHV